MDNGHGGTMATGQCFRKVYPTLLQKILLHCKKKIQNDFKINNALTDIKF